MTAAATLRLYDTLAAQGTLTIVALKRAGRVEAALHRLNPIGIYEAQGPDLSAALRTLAALVREDSPPEVNT